MMNSAGLINSAGSMNSTTEPEITLFFGFYRFQLLSALLPVGRVPARGKRYTLRIFLLPVGLRVVIQELEMSVQFFCSIILIETSF